MASTDDNLDLSLLCSYDRPRERIGTEPDMDISNIPLVLLAPLLTLLPWAPAATGDPVVLRYQEVEVSKTSWKAQVDKE